MKLEHLLRILDWVPRNDDNEEHNLAAQIEKKKKNWRKKHTKHTGQQIQRETQMYVLFHLQMIKFRECHTDIERSDIVFAFR